MEKKYEYIAAVDFGTSRTGFAWCISGQIAGIPDIYIQKNWPGLPNKYAKTYSELFYDSQHNKWYFGGEAHQIRFTGKNFEGNYVKGEHFQEYKRNLYDISRSYNKNEDSSEKQYDKTMDLIVETLKAMKEYIWKDMCKNLGGKLSPKSFEQEVQWVFTVPEDTTDGNKDYIRSAAIKAGLIKEGNEDLERLVFVLETEASIITYFNDGSVEFLADDRDEQIIIVLDAGSEMVNVSIKKWLPENFVLQKLSSIEKVCEVCEPAGAKYMDNCFLNYLSNLFGSRAFNELLNKHRDDFKNIADDWVIGKEYTTNCDSGANFEIDIDVSALWKILEDISPDEYKLLINEIDKSPEKIVIKNNYTYMFSGQHNNYLIINRKMFGFIFHKVFENAYSPLKKVLEQLVAQNIKYKNLVLLFVGGFSCNPCLTDFMAIQASRKLRSQCFYPKDVRSNKEGASVLYGAVLLGVSHILHKQYIQLEKSRQTAHKRCEELEKDAIMLQERYKKIKKIIPQFKGSVLWNDNDTKELNRLEELRRYAEQLKKSYKNYENEILSLQKVYEKFNKDNEEVANSSELQRLYKESEDIGLQIEEGYPELKRAIFIMTEKFKNIMKYIFYKYKFF